jgi:hypothetical protein
MIAFWSHNPIHKGVSTMATYYVRMDQSVRPVDAVNVIADTMLQLPDGYPTLEGWMADANPFGMLGVQWHVATPNEVAQWTADRQTRRPTFTGSTWYHVEEEE